MAKYSTKGTRNILTLAVVALGLIAVVLVNQSRTIKQNSKASVGLMCKPPADVVLAIDFSGSMVREINTNPPLANEKLAKAKEAAKTLVNQLFTYQNVKIGLVTFGTCQTPSQTAIRSQLKGSTDKDQLLSSIDALSININEAGAYTTCTPEGLLMADTILSSDQTAGVAKYIVMITDGKPVIGTLSDSAAAKATLDVAKTGIDKGYADYIIGIGPKTAAEFNEELMQCLAGVYTADTYAGASCLKNRKTPGKYFYSPTASDLSSIVTEIGGTICTSEGPRCNYAEIVVP